MPIFGQVWLWSSLAFLLGALLCWALVALPARRRVGELEDELASYDRQPRTMVQGRRHRALDDEYDEYGLRRSPRRPPLEARPPRGARAARPRLRLPAARPTTPARRPPCAVPLDGLAHLARVTDTELADGPRSGTTQYLNVASGSLGAGTLEAPPEVPAAARGPRLVRRRRGPRGRAAGGDHPAAGQAGRRSTGAWWTTRASPPPDEGGTVFTQRTHPIPGELIRQLDEAGKAEQRADEPADALVDDLADEDAGSQAGADRRSPSRPPRRASSRPRFARPRR